MSKINTFHNDKFSVVYSNIPRPSDSADKLNISILNNFTKTVTLPDYNIEVIDSFFGTTRRIHPSTKLNTDLTQLTIDFILDEDLENYFAFYDWMREIKTGKKTKGDMKLHESTIWTK
jgi:hypothetical protein